MLFGNCYTFAISRYLKRGGWILFRPSAKTACAASRSSLIVDAPLHQNPYLADEGRRHEQQPRRD